MKYLNIKIYDIIQSRIIILVKEKNVDNTNMVKDYTS